MLEGMASGGPRDGVKLTAPESWDGLIQFAGTYYPGYYFWSVVEQTWVWCSSHGMNWSSRHYGSKAL